jgi:hypothetical protein
MFFSQLIIGAVFMVFFYVVTSIMSIIKQAVSLTSTSTVTSDNGPVMFFGIIMMLVLLTIMMRVVKKLSGEVGASVSKVAGVGLGLVGGGVGLAARATVGRAAVAMRDSNFMKYNKDSILGKRAYNLSKGLASSSYNFNKLQSVQSVYKKDGISVKNINDTTYEKSLQARNAEDKANYDMVDSEYKEDEFDKDGNIVHRKGDVNVAGAAAAQRFMQKRGGAGANTPYDKAKSFVFNKKTLRDELAKDDVARGEKRVKEQEAGANTFLGDYNKIVSKKDAQGNTITSKKELQEKYLSDLTEQLDTVRITDPNQVGTVAQSLVQGINAIKEKSKSDDQAFNTQVAQALRIYTAKDEKRRAEYLASQSDEIKKRLEEEIARAPVPAGGEQAPAPTYSAGGVPVGNLGEFDLTATLRGPKPGFLMTSDDLIDRRSAEKNVGQTPTVNPPQPQNTNTPTSASSNNREPETV